MIDSPAAVVLVLAALAAVPLLLRRHRAAGPDGLHVLARTALHKGAVVAVVAVGGRRMLVGAGEGGVRLLAELGDAPVDEDDTLGTPHLDAVTTTAAPAGRTDVAGSTTSTGTGDLEAALAALRVEAPRSRTTSTGPGIGLLDRLRAMTVRTPTAGRQIRVPLRR